MNKYYMNHNNMEMEPCSTGQYYLVSDVDARIAELERALKSCSAVISAELKERAKFQAAAADALNEADKALSL